VVTRVFSHRGRTEDAPGTLENTVAAFRTARSLGCDGVELDVRRTADGVLVVHHDSEVTGVGPLHTVTRRQLPPHVALLEEALGACDGMIVNVEIKAAPRDEPSQGSTSGTDADTVTAEHTAATLVSLGWTDRVIVSSFHPTILDAVRRTEPTLALGWLLEWSGDARIGLGVVAAHGWQAVHPFVSQVDSTLLEAAHQAGVAVHVWTVNARGDLEAMADLGVDAVITDRPGEALEVMGHRPR